MSDRMRDYLVWCESVSSRDDHWWFEDAEGIVKKYDALVAERDKLMGERERNRTELVRVDELRRAAEKERDEAVEMSRQMVAAYELAGEETDAAEAEVARLREALQAIVQMQGARDYAYVEVENMVDIARAALGEDA